MRDSLGGVGTVPEGPRIVSTGGASPAARRAKRNPWIRSAVAVPPPLRGGLTFVPEHHGFRPAAPDFTRGYSPSPLSGRCVRPGGSVRDRKPRLFLTKGMGRLPPRTAFTRGMPKQRVSNR